MLTIQMQSRRERDAETLATLTRRVSVLSLDQVAFAWWDDADEPEVATSRRLRALERRDLVHCFTSRAPRETLSEGPLGSWEPGEEEPRFDYIAAELRRRLAEPVGEMLCVVATKVASEEYGGMASMPPAGEELAHGVRLAAAYLRIRLEHPLQAYTWRLASDSESDAVMEDRFFTRPRPVAVICGRREDADILRALHRRRQEQGLAYQIW